MVYTSCTSYTLVYLAHLIWRRTPPREVAGGGTEPSEGGGMSDPMISVRGLEKSYGSPAVLHGVDLEVRRGEILALLGPNGAGKTTTVNILTTLVKPDGGTARVEGVDVVRHPRAARARIALTGQYASVDLFQTGEENLAMMARLAHLPRADVRTRPAVLLGRFGLTGAPRRPGPPPRARAHVPRRHAAAAGPADQPRVEAAGPRARRADDGPRPARAQRA